MMDFNELKTILSGKRVALVGNAKSIFGKNHGAEIDGYDVVMRFNYGEIKSARDQGKRTDILATSDSRIEWDFIRDKFSPRLVIWLSSKGPTMLLAPSDIPLFCPPGEVIHELQAKTSPHKPSSGIKAAYLIIEKFGVDSVDLYGFDFFNTRSFYNRIHWRFWRKRRMPHDGSAERVILESMGVRIH